MVIVVPYNPITVIHIELKEMKNFLSTQEPNQPFQSLNPSPGNNMIRLQSNQMNNSGSSDMQNMKMPGTFY